MKDELEYQDIIHLPRHVSKMRTHMPTLGRAAQFASFAALTGYDAAIRETARLTDERIELDEYSKSLLNASLQIIMDRVEEHLEIDITFFRPDATKHGGAYITAIGAVKKIDEFKRTVLMTDNTLIPIDEIIRIDTAGCGQCFGE